MKKMWWAIAALVLLFAATLYNSHYISSVTKSLSKQLTGAEQLAEAGKWEEAEALTLQAQADWEKHAGYFYTVLRHSDTDAVQTNFRKTLEFLYTQEGGEYSSANAELMTQIELLSDMERLTLRNVL